ncbi:MAG: hypothetical protein ACLFPS_07270 [Clostridia bacterium]
MIFRHFYTVWELLKDPRVSTISKLVFIISSVGYFIAPVIPFMPLDDFLFIYIASLIFKHIASKQIGINKKTKFYSKDKDNKNTIDVEGKIVE